MNPQMANTRNAESESAEDVAPVAPTRSVGSIRLTLTLLGALVMCLAGYEALEALWLNSLDSQALAALRYSRRVAVATITSLLVVIFLSSWSPGITVQAAVGDLPTGSSAGKRERARIAFCSWWFVQMRWVAILLAGGLIFLTVVVGGLLPDSVLAPLILIISILIAFNATLWKLLHHGVVSNWILNTQLHIDAVALMVMLHFSGGIENPLYIMALFLVIIGGIVLSKLQCFAVASTASLCLALLALGEWSEFLSHYTLEVVPHGEDGEIHASHSGEYAACLVAIFTGVLFLTAHFVSRLSAQLRDDRHSLEHWATRAYVQRKLLEQALATTSTGVRVRSAMLEPRWSNQQWHEWFDTLDDKDGSSDPCPSPVKDVLRDGLARSVELSLPGHSHHEKRFFRIVTAPIRREDGSIQQIVDLAQEVTKEKREQERLLRMSQLAVVGELASHVAHEVNNPIAILSAKARLLLSNFHDELPGKVKTDLEKIVDLSDRVARIAQGLLSYSRLSSGARVSIDIRAPIQGALDLVRERAGKQQVLFDTDFADDVPKIVANPQELEQVFLNLYVNALQAMPSGGHLRIRVTLEHRDRPGIQIIVQDTGAGIPPEIRERVFEPFFTTKGGSKGTGLGLSVSYGLISSHGGDIGIATDVDDGTSLVVWLPIEIEPRLARVD